MILFECRECNDKHANEMLVRVIALGMIINP